MELTITLNIDHQQSFNPKALYLLQLIMKIIQRQVTVQAIHYNILKSL